MFVNLSTQENSVFAVAVGWAHTSEVGAQAWQCSQGVNIVFSSGLLEAWIMLDELFGTILIHVVTPANYVMSLPVYVLWLVS